MPKKRRQAKIPTPAWERPRGAIGRRILGRSGQFYGTVAVAVLIVIALGIVGYAFLNDYVEKQRRPGSTAIQVEDTKFRLDYFSNRLKMYVGQLGGQGSDPAQPVSALPAVAELLIQEEIIRQFAGEFDISADEAEVRDATAERLGITADDSTYDAVFKQELARTGISEQDYLRMMEASVLNSKLRQRFRIDVPATAESAHYRQIVVGTEEKATELKGDIEGGGDFAELASANSLDDQTRDKGGDMGWVAKGVLDASLEELLFVLEPNEVTTIPTAQGSLVIQMLEKAPSRAVEDDDKAQLAERAFAKWVQEKKDSIVLVNNMDLSDGDPKKIEWAVKRAYEG